MNSGGLSPWRLCRLTAAVLAAATSSHAEELRGFWVDAFNQGIKTSSQISALVEDARRANCNALFVQVRKRGDAYFSNGLEPRATDITSAGFDPLADLVAKARSGPEPLAVHAWIVTYNIWNQQNTSPSQPSHPFNLHRDWLTQRNDGVQWDGANYAFDPAHPSVQDHTFRVCMDILARYQVDGLHLDYIRYTDSGSSVGSNPWGYHPLALQRFRSLTGRSDTPAAGDPAWLQFRRDQVTALVRKLQLHAWQLRPSLCLSAATIAYGSAPASNSVSAWQQRDAFGRVLQDWRGWLEEGILDLAIPMVYRDNTNATRASEWIAWTRWARDNQFNRLCAAGLGNYLNAVEGTLSQISSARAASTTTGRRLAGQVLYSYATWCRRQNADTTYTSNYLPRQDFLNALSDPAAAAAFSTSPLYPAPVSIPAMPWKSDPSRAPLMGFVRLPDASLWPDGTPVTLSGPQGQSITLKTDATGFFGTTGLPPGTWTIAVQIPGFPARTRTLTLQGGKVTSQNLWLSPAPFTVTSVQHDRTLRRTTVTWNSLPESRYRIETSTDFATWTAAATGVASSGFSTAWTSTADPPGAFRRFFRIAEE